MYLQWRYVCKHTSSYVYIYTYIYIVRQRFRSRSSSLGLQRLMSEFNSRLEHSSFLVVCHTAGGALRNPKPPKDLGLPGTKQSPHSQFNVATVSCTSSMPPNETRKYLGLDVSRSSLPKLLDPTCGGAKQDRQSPEVVAQRH